MENDLSATPSFKACLFDLDGVLVDSMELHYQAWRDAFARAGANVDGENFKRDFYMLEGAGGVAISKTLLKKYPAGGSASVEDICKSKNSAFLNITGELPLIEGQKELLSFLKSAGVKLALVTGSVREVTMALVERCFPGIFDYVVTANDITKCKPDPMPYLTAAAKLGVAPSECIVIENAPLGVEAGVRAGCRVVGLLATSPLDESILLERGAAVVCRDAPQLRRELEKWIV